jgi:hypothetical protein
LSASWKGEKSVEDLPIDLEELQKMVLSERTANQKLRGMCGIYMYLKRDSKNLEDLHI